MGSSLAASSRLPAEQRSGADVVRVRACRASSRCLAPLSALPSCLLRGIAPLERRACGAGPVFHMPLGLGSCAAHRWQAASARREEEKASERDRDPWEQRKKVDVGVRCNHVAENISRYWQSNQETTFTPASARRHAGELWVARCTHAEVLHLFAKVRAAIRITAVSTLPAVPTVVPTAVRATLVDPHCAGRGGRIDNSRARRSSDT